MSKTPVSSWYQVSIFLTLKIGPMTRTLREAFQCIFKLVFEMMAASNDNRMSVEGAVNEQYTYLS